MEAVREGASGRKVIQAEKSTSVEYLRSECGWKVPGKLGWPVYLKQHKRGGRLGDEV